MLSYVLVLFCNHSYVEDTFPFHHFEVLYIRGVYSKALKSFSTFSFGSVSVFWAL